MRKETEQGLKKAGRIILWACVMATATSLHAAGVKGWPGQVTTVNYPASIDNTQQPMLLVAAKSKDLRPLLVGLHTWTADFTQSMSSPYARWAIQEDWHFIHPNFRGPNWTPDACGSDKMVQDIIDAVKYMTANYNVDTDRIYLIGVSGGGYAALLMAGRAPEIWAGVSAWCPISDVHAWWKQKDGNARYAKDIEKAVGGRPDQSPEAIEECVKRSPLTYLDKASGVNLDINAGVYDGRKGSVPFTHSLYAFNAVVPEKDRMAPELIEAFYKQVRLPDGLEKPDPDPLYGEKNVIFRRTADHARVTIFNGRHEIIQVAGLNWLAQQRKGKPAQWTTPNPRALETEKHESESGK